MYTTKNTYQNIMDTTEAVCAQVDPELFFPEKGPVGTQVRLAKRLCAVCPLLEACLEEALVNSHEYGIWGGATTSERRILNRNKKIIPLHIEAIRKLAPKENDETERATEQLVRSFE